MDHTELQLQLLLPLQPLRERRGTAQLTLGNRIFRWSPNYPSMRKARQMQVEDAYSCEVNQDEHAEATALADELLADIELDRISIGKQVLKASRLARLVNDPEASEWLKRERNGYSSKLESDARFRRGGRNGKEGDDPIYTSTVILDGIVRPLNAKPTASTSGQLVRFNMILIRVSTMIHDFASSQYYGLRFSARQHSMFERSKKQIDLLLSDLDPETIRRIDAALDGIRAGDAESIAAAMNSTRRLIDSFADAVFPAIDETRPDGQGGETKLGHQQRLNRIKAFVDDHAISPGQAKRPKRAIADIYERVSVGVHNDVTAAEAEFLFLSTYVLLGEILYISQEEQPSEKVKLG